VKIDLTNIPSEGKEANFILEPDWWKPDLDEDRIVGLESPLSAWMKIYPAGKKIVVEGSLSTKLLLRCDRCLEPYSWDLSKDFRIYLAISQFKGNVEVELLEDDLNLEFIDQVIREQLILNVPMKTLCTADCKGLCPICGCNLNTTTCSCSSNCKASGNVS